MQIIITVMILPIMALFITDEHKLIIYTRILCFIIPLWFFFLNFSFEYDLYRHYKLFEELQSYSLRGLLINSNSRISIMIDEEPLYVLIVWILARVRIKPLLPYITGVLVYNVGISILTDFKYRYNISNKIYTIVTVLFFVITDFIGITGIRNIFCATMFLFLFYYEVIAEKNKIIIYICYLLLCLIHVTTVIYIAIRLVLFFYNKGTRLFINGIIVLLFTLSPIVFAKYNYWFYRIPIIKNIAWLYYKYFNGYSGGISLRGVRISYAFFYLFGFGVAVALKKINLDKKVETIVDYSIISFLFTLGSYSQYDIFARYIFLFTPLICLLLSMYLHFITINDSIWIIRAESYFQIFNHICVYCLGFLSILIIVMYRFVYQYYPITRYFTLWIK